jgi:hypothetical protein
MVWALYGETDSGHGSPGPVGRDAGEVGGERALQTPEVAQHLHPQPELGAIAAELGKAQRHLGGDRLLGPKQPVQGHPADADLTRGLGDRQLQPVAEDFPQKLAPGGVGQHEGRPVTAQSQALVGTGRPSPISSLAQDLLEPVGTLSRQA